MLWIWYSNASDEQTREACRLAHNELIKRGFSPHMAQQATFDAADLPEDADPDATTPEAAAVLAWYAAEEIAFKHLFEATGEWPHQASLIVTTEDFS